MLVYRWIGVLLAVWACSAHGADFWIAIGSYSTEANAQRARESATTSIADNMSVVGTETGQGYFYRLVAGPYASRADAEGVLPGVQASGYAGAWVWRRGASTELVHYSSTTAADVDDNLSEYSDIDWSSGGLDEDYQLDSLPDNVPKLSEREQTDRQLVEEAPPGYQLHKMRRDSFD